MMICSMISTLVIWRYLSEVLHPIATIFHSWKVSDSQAKKMGQSEYVSKKPSKTFALIKSEMDEKAKRKNKSMSRVGILSWEHLICWPAEQVDEVAYVDKQRNIAISLGERDVKADVKAKNK